ncbi:MAG TPA: transglutaminase-like domain-containing protein [Verrucomicrobiae bacterium]|jgi:regulator of sirC expression with transglutaminase-like and TPR domain|nr:transglutaminase-like domain-containing protein [Verrucomicrobiae bacterium]
MRSPVTVTPAKELSESQWKALVNLLADDDPAIYRTVRDKILSVGEEAGEWLRPYRLSDDALLRRRAREIVLHFDRQEADTWFLAFCLRHGEEFDLEEGIWLLALTQYPDINVEAYRALMDHFAAELRERIDSSETPKEILTTINNYIFDELGFTGDEENYYDPQNSYLNRVIDRRKGNPINLSLLYLLLARRLRLPMAGIGLPGHFICRYQSSQDEIYVDAFHHGKFLTKADCIQYLVSGSHGLQDEFLSPVSTRRLLMRICSNLHQIYSQKELAEETTRLQRYLVALAR